MLEVGWSELLVIGIVALIVVGPRDLPRMFRALGQFTAKARGMAREFQRAMEAAANEAGVKDVAKDLRAVADPKKMGLDALRDATRALDARPGATRAVQTGAAAPATAAPAAPIILRPTPPSEMDAIPDPPEPAAAPAAPARGLETQALAEQQAARRAEIASAAQAARGQTAVPSPEDPAAS